MDNRPDADRPETVDVSYASLCEPDIEAMLEHLAGVLASQLGDTR